MPDSTGQPDDAQTGNGGKPEGDQSGAAGAAGAGDAPKQITLTQEQLDAIVQDRALRETRSKFADYDELKRKAAEHDKLQEGQKTELEKANEKAVKAEQKANEAIARANARIVRAEILSQAAAQNAVDPDTVAALLAGNESITIDDDGTVAGVKEAVKALLKEKPFLAKGAPGSGPSGGEFGGADNRTLVEKIAELERAGKFAEARELKLQQMSTVG